MEPGEEDQSKPGKRTVLQEAGKHGKACSEVERFAGLKSHVEMLHKCPTFLRE